MVGIVLGFAGLVPAVPALHADPFTYTNRDLLLCFRKTGQDGMGTTSPYSFEVNIGPAAVYYSAPAGSTNAVGHFSSAQLAAVFDTLDDVSWSVSGFVDPSDTGTPVLAADTLWVVAPRSDPDATATAWGRQSANNQSQVAAAVSSMFEGARLYSASVAASADFNTTSAVRLPVGNGWEFGEFMGTSGDYQGSFQGDVENITPSDFVESGTTVSRSDLYQLDPTTSRSEVGTAGVYVGYFEFQPAGTLVFVAASSSSSTPPRPTAAVSHAAGVNTISFLSTSGVTYKLRYTNSAGLSSPLASWAVSSTTVTGDGTTKFFTDSVTVAERFYVIEAHY